MEKKKNFMDAMLERCIDRGRVIRCYMSNGFQVRGRLEDYNDQFLKIRLRDGGSFYLNRDQISTYEPNPPKPPKPEEKDDGK